MVDLLRELKTNDQPVNLLAELDQGQDPRFRELGEVVDPALVQSKYNELISFGAPEDVAFKQAQRMAVQGIKAKATGEFASGIPGALPTLVSGAVAEPIAGLAGLAGAAGGKIANALGADIKPGLGARTVENVRDALTIDPVGEKAEKSLQTVGSLLEPIATISENIGDATMDATGSPLAATAVETALVGIPEAVAARFGIKTGAQASKARSLARMNRALLDKDGLPSKAFEGALKKRDVDFGALIGDEGSLPLVFGKTSPDDFVDSLITSKIKSGDATGELYKYRLAGGKVVPDDLGKEALRQGFKKGDIASAKGANKATKAAMIDMIRKKRAIESDSTKALDFRPSDVIGSKTMDRFNYIRSEALELRDSLNRLAEGRYNESVGGRKLIGKDNGFLKGRRINTDAVVDDYMSGLDDLKISIDDSPGKPKLDFSNSLISEDKTSQRILKSVTNILAKGGDIDAADAHLVKRQLDTMLDFNKKSATGLTDAGEKFAKKIRASINESIRDSSPEYAAINDKLSRSLGAMQDFDKALGGGIDAFADNANASVGQTLRRLLSNVQSRADLSDALVNIDNVAKDMGGVFDADIKRLVVFNKALDDRFGATARTSLGGEVESAIRSGPVQAGREFVAKKAGEKITELRGIGDTEAFNVMERILKRGNERI